MNPKHRDRVAFVRIVSGKFERDMNVLNTRSGEKMRLGNSQRLFARERETVDDAYAGDVVGLVGNYDLLIGDTLASRPGVAFHEIPRFAPECFSYLHNKSTAKYKRFRDGLEQLLKEGVASEFKLLDAGPTSVPLLGAVGPLQFEVLQYRLEGEYAAETRIEQASWNIARWLKPKDGDPLAPGSETLALARHRPRPRLERLARRPAAQRMGAQDLRRQERGLDHLRPTVSAAGGAGEVIEIANTLVT